MAVGEIVPGKFIWLLDDVEAVGTVMNLNSTGDDFDLLLDEGYRHLISYFRGNNPLPWRSTGDPGLLHIETYPPDPTLINRSTFWRLPQKPGQPFRVRTTTGIRDLQDGDHVRIVGRWVIDHHPEYCQEIPPTLNPPEKDRCVHRGLLLVGNVHTELHPFYWDQIDLVESLAPSSKTEQVLSLAAPLYEQQYLGLWKHAANELAGVAGKVFISEGEGNFHRVVSASMTVRAPVLPAGLSPHRDLVMAQETVLKIGTGLALNNVRTITQLNDGIRVDAKVAGSSIHDPANDKATFQARYEVGWRSRLEVREAQPLHIGSTTPGKPLDFAITVWNVGPDPITLTAVRQDRFDAVFSFPAASGQVVPAQSNATLVGSFSPPPWLTGRFETYPPYDVESNLSIESTDLKALIRVRRCPCGLRDPPVLQPSIPFFQ
jgi:hypothetical protein